MADYIDRQAALDALGERPLVWTEDDYYSLGARNQYDGDRLAIETIPSADVEPIVRCKDCKHRCGDYCHNDDGFAHFDHFFVHLDDYCSRGERMDGVEKCL